METIRHLRVDPRPAVGILAVGAYVVVLFWAMSAATYNVWGAIMIAPVLVLLTLPIARRVARSEEDPRIIRIILWALMLKLAASIVRHFVAFEVYDGSADAARYIDYGQDMAQSFWHGIFDVETPAGSSGTEFTSYVVGVVFSLTGPTALGAYLVFSWLGFLGLCFFYRAFRIGIPDGDYRRYALLLFFLPSMLFWPSGIGKEAWMMLTLGISAYGVARILTGRPGGYLAGGLGVLGAAMVRPHMGALVAASLVAAYPFRRGHVGRSMGPVARVLGMAVLLAGLLVVVQAAEERFDVQNEGLQGAETAIDEAAEQTAKGGSEFEAVRPDSPLDIPMAAFSVLFRPLPHEAHNAQALVASFEGVLLIGLFALALPRLPGVARQVWRRPYLLFSMAYSLLFVIAFSSFGNFGILVRQRVQLFPLILIALAVPAVARAKRKPESTTASLAPAAPSPHR